MRLISSAPRTTLAAALLAGLAVTTVAAVPARAAEPTVDLQILTINDFHGRLQSPATVNGQPVGGAAQLVGLVDRLRAGNPNTAFVSAGDNIGASTFISAIDGDTPTIDALNAGGLAVSAVGNHEFDKGIDDLLGRVTDRAAFPLLGANVYRDGARALPAYSVQELGGVRVGYVGVVTPQTANLVSPSGIAGVQFRDPVAEANSVAAQLSDGNAANGEADVVVLLAHEGAAPENIGSPEQLAADPVFGPFTRVGADIDAVVGGHTHQPYAFQLPVPGTDRTRPVLQAHEYGRKLGRITLSVDPATRAVTASTAELVDVVGAPQNPAVADIVTRAAATANELGKRPLGSITADIRRAYTNGAENRGAESALGNFIADVQLAGTADPGRGGAQLAFMNPGGLRADLLHAPDGVVTYSEAFAVQPFANDVVTQTLTGAQLKQVLEEQWQPDGASRPVLWLGVSKGFSYAYDPTQPRGQRVIARSMKLDGVRIDPAKQYRVTQNSFLASGGDNFTTLGKGTNRVTTGDNDLTMLTDYLAKNSPVTADVAPRSTVGRVIPLPACTRTVTGTYRGALAVGSGVTCVSDATVRGPVTVWGGGSLIVTGGTIAGPVTALGAATVSLTDVAVTGPVTLAAGTATLVIDETTVTGPVSLLGNKTTESPVVAGSTIRGPLFCTANAPAPVNDGRPNTVHGPVKGECTAL
ncbi:5'-nucleotidase [Micromonospora pattaloongensis]|uniref:5'-nucleotidase n=1 Tax=Micromonospora pattaloongensis TaxID=405436 RepID=A0A1H3FTT9_9ACTN|nr:bifunctional UDP-sugar hydrolase/5'-nucleotidase [Micromonospora pattaloongensis]SDX94371.1 5'-nucleotidase [Micromonospora pattaloongensis]